VTDVTPPVTVSVTCGAAGRDGSPVAVPLVAIPTPLLDAARPVRKTPVSVVEVPAVIVAAPDVKTADRRSGWSRRHCNGRRLVTVVPQPLHCRGRVV